MTESYKCDLCNEDSNQFFMVSGSKRSIIFTSCPKCASRNKEFIPLHLKLNELSLEDFVINEVMESNVRIHPAKFMRAGITILGDLLS